MQEPIPIFCGFDPREAAGYHVFAQSVIERASVPVSFIPLHKPLIEDFDGQKDGTNAFIYSRFLVPHIMGYRGWAIFADACDMVCVDDIEKLWERFELQTVQKVGDHNYYTILYAKPRIEGVNGKKLVA